MSGDVPWTLVGHVCRASVVAARSWGLCGNAHSSRHDDSRVLESLRQCCLNWPCYKTRNSIQSSSSTECIRLDVDEISVASLAAPLPKRLIIIDRRTAPAHTTRHALHQLRAWLRLIHPLHHTASAKERNGHPKHRSLARAWGQVRPRGPGWVLLCSLQLLWLAASARFAAAARSSETLWMTSARSNEPALTTTTTTSISLSTATATSAARKALVPFAQALSWLAALTRAMLLAVPGSHPLTQYCLVACDSCHRSSSRSSLCNRSLQSLCLDMVCRAGRWARIAKDHEGGLCTAAFTSIFHDCCQTTAALCRGTHTPRSTGTRDAATFLAEWVVTSYQDMLRDCDRRRSIANDTRDTRDTLRGSTADAMAETQRWCGMAAACQALNALLCADHVHIHTHTSDAPSLQPLSPDLDLDTHLHADRDGADSVPRLSLAQSIAREQEKRGGQGTLLEALLFVVAMGVSLQRRELGGPGRGTGNRTHSNNEQKEGPQSALTERAIWRLWWRLRFRVPAVSAGESLVGGSMGGGEQEMRWLDIWISRDLASCALPRTPEPHPQLALAAVGSTGVLLALCRGDGVAASRIFAPQRGLRSARDIHTPERTAGSDSADPGLAYILGVLLMQCVRRWWTVGRAGAGLSVGRTSAGVHLRTSSVSHTPRDTTRTPTGTTITPTAPPAPHLTQVWTSGVETPCAWLSLQTTLALCADLAAVPAASAMGWRAGFLSCLGLWIPSTDTHPSDQEQGYNRTFSRGSSSAATLMSAANPLYSAHPTNTTHVNGATGGHRSAPLDASEMHADTAHNATSPESRADSVVANRYALYASGNLNVLRSVLEWCAERVGDCTAGLSPPYTLHRNQRRTTPSSDNDTTKRRALNPSRVPLAGTGYLWAGLVWQVVSVLKAVRRGLQDHAPPPSPSRVPGRVVSLSGAVTAAGAWAGALVLRRVHRAAWLVVRAVCDRLRRLSPVGVDQHNNRTRTSRREEPHGATCFTRPVARHWLVVAKLCAVEVAALLRDVGQGLVSTRMHHQGLESRRRSTRSVPGGKYGIHDESSTHSHAHTADQRTGGWPEDQKHTGMGGDVTGRWVGVGERKEMTVDDRKDAPAVLPTGTLQASSVAVHATNSTTTGTLVTAASSTPAVLYASMPAGTDSVTDTVAVAAQQLGGLPSSPQHRIHTPAGLTETPEAPASGEASAMDSDRLFHSYVQLLSHALQHNKQNQTSEAGSPRTLLARTDAADMIIPDSADMMNPVSQDPTAVDRPTGSPAVTRTLTAVQGERPLDIIASPSSGGSTAHPPPPPPSPPEAPVTRIASSFVHWGATEGPMGLTPAPTNSSVAAGRTPHPTPASASGTPARGKRTPQRGETLLLPTGALAGDALVTAVLDALRRNPFPAALTSRGRRSKKKPKRHAGGSRGGHDFWGASVLDVHVLAGLFHAAAQLSRGHDAHSNGHTTAGQYKSGDGGHHGSSAGAAHFAPSGVSSALASNESPWVWVAPYLPLLPVCMSRSVTSRAPQRDSADVVDASQGTAPGDGTISVPVSVGAPVEEGVAMFEAGASLRRSHHLHQHQHGRNPEYRRHDHQQQQHADHQQQLQQHSSTTAGVRNASGADLDARTDLAAVFQQDAMALLLTPAVTDRGSARPGRGTRGGKLRKKGAGRSARRVHRGGKGRSARHAGPTRRAKSTGVRSTALVRRSARQQNERVFNGTGGARSGAGGGGGGGGVDNVQWSRTLRSSSRRPPPPPPSPPTPSTPRDVPSENISGSSGLSTPSAHNPANGAVSSPPIQLNVEDDVLFVEEADDEEQLDVFGRPGHSSGLFEDVAALMMHGETLDGDHTSLPDPIGGVNVSSVDVDAETRGLDWGNNAQPPTPSLNTATSTATSSAERTVDNQNTGAASSDTAESLVYEGRPATHESKRDNTQADSPATGPDPTELLTPSTVNSVLGDISPLVLKYLSPTDRQAFLRQARSGSTSHSATTTPSHPHSVASTSSTPTGPSTSPSVTGSPGTPLSSVQTPGSAAHQSAVNVSAELDVLLGARSPVSDPDTNVHTTTTTATATSTLTPTTTTTTITAMHPSAPPALPRLDMRRAERFAALEDARTPSPQPLPSLTPKSSGRSTVGQGGDGMAAMSDEQLHGASNGSGNSPSGAPASPSTQHSAAQQQVADRTQPTAGQQLKMFMASLPSELASSPLLADAGARANMPAGSITRGQHSVPSSPSAGRSVDARPTGSATRGGGGEVLETIPSTEPDPWTRVEQMAAQLNALDGTDGTSQHSSIQRMGVGRADSPVAIDGDAELDGGALGVSASFAGTAGVTSSGARDTLAAVDSVAGDTAAVSAGGASVTAGAADSSSIVGGGKDDAFLLSSEHPAYLPHHTSPLAGTRAAELTASTALTLARPLASTGDAEDHHHHHTTTTPTEQPATLDTLVSEQSLLRHCSLAQKTREWGRVLEACGAESSARSQLVLEQATAALHCVTRGSGSGGVLGVDRTARLDMLGLRTRSRHGSPPLGHSAEVWRHSPPTALAFHRLQRGSSGDRTAGGTSAVAAHTPAPRMHDHLRPYPCLGNQKDRRRVSARALCMDGVGMWLAAVECACVWDSLDVCLRSVDSAATGRADIQLHKGTHGSEASSPTGPSVSAGPSSPAGPHGLSGRTQTPSACLMDRLASTLPALWGTLTSTQCLHGLDGSPRSHGPHPSTCSNVTARIGNAMVESARSTLLSAALQHACSRPSNVPQTTTIATNTATGTSTTATTAVAQAETRLVPSQKRPVSTGSTSTHLQRLPASVTVLPDAAPNTQLCECLAAAMGSVIAGFAVQFMGLVLAQVSARCAWEMSVEASADGRMTGPGHSDAASCTAFDSTITNTTIGATTTPTTTTTTSTAAHSHLQASVGPVIADQDWALARVLGVCAALCDTQGVVTGALGSWLVPDHQHKHATAALARFCVGVLHARRATGENPRQRSYYEDELDVSPAMTAEGRTAFEKHQSARKTTGSADGRRDLQECGWAQGWWCRLQAGLTFAGACRSSAGVDAGVLSGGDEMPLAHDHALFTHTHGDHHRHRDYTGLPPAQCTSDTLSALRQPLQVYLCVLGSAGHVVGSQMLARQLAAQAQTPATTASSSSTAVTRRPASTAREPRDTTTPSQFGQSAVLFPGDGAIEGAVTQTADSSAVCSDARCRLRRVRLAAALAEFRRVQSQRLSLLQARLSHQQSLQQRQVAAHQQTTMQARQQLEQAQIELSQHATAQAALKGQIATLQKRVVNADLCGRRDQRLARQAQEALSGQQSAVRQWRERAEQASADGRALAADVKELRAQIHTHTQQHASAQEQTQELRAQLAMAQQEAAALRESQAVATATQQRLEARLAEADARQARTSVEAEEQGVQLRGARQRVETLSAALSEQERQFTQRVQKMGSKLQLESRDREQAQQRAEQLEGQLRASHSAQTQLQGQVVDLQRERQTLQATQQELSRQAASWRSKHQRLAQFLSTMSDTFAAESQSH